MMVKIINSYNKEHGKKEEVIPKNKCSKGAKEKEGGKFYKKERK
jgi:hypothetical protein